MDHCNDERRLRMHAGWILDRLGDREERLQCVEFGCFDG